jgi:hypothetical protein
MLTLGLDKIKEYYDKQLWDKGMVWDAVSKNKITQADYTTITDDTYPTTRPI